MKIIELCTSKGWGGLEIYVCQVARWLMQHQHVCRVVTVTDSLLVRRLAAAEIDSIPISPWFRPLPLLSALQLARLIDQSQIDVLHVHWTRDLVLAALTKKFARRPVKLVFSRHMALTRHKRDFYHRFIYGSVDLYLVITRQLYNQARQYLPLPEDKLQVLYHGVADITPSDSDHCQRFYVINNLQPGKFHVLLPGRIEYYKGQHILVEAMAILQQRGVELEAVLLGHIMDQNYYTQLQQQIRQQGLDKKIHYLGFVDDPGSIYSCFDVVILTTYAETFGLVLVEAMKSGVTVIGTNAGGVPEIIEHEHTGLLFRPGDANELADYLQRLSEEPEYCAQLASAGKAYADRTFSEQEHYTKLTQLFSDLVSH